MAVNRTARVEAKGLAELRKSLRQMGDRELMREFAKLNQDVADVVVRKARQRARSEGRQQASAADNAMKGMRLQSAARIVLANSRRIPYALGAEFGAKQNQRRRIAPRSTVARTDPGFTPGAVRYMQGWNQFPEWAGNAFTSDGRGGHFLFPTIRAERENIIDDYLEAVERFVDKNIPDGPKLRR